MVFEEAIERFQYNEEQPNGGKPKSRTASMVDKKGPEQDVSDMISTFSNLDLDLEEVDDRMIEL